MLPGILNHGELIGVIGWHLFVLSAGIKNPASEMSLMPDIAQTLNFIINNVYPGTNPDFNVRFFVNIKYLPF